MFLVPISVRVNTTYTFIILYFSILLHCNVQWILQVMFPSACSFKKYNERKQRNKQMQTCSVCPRKKREKEKQQSRILQAYENKISYTPEDGHVGRNMW
jgi:hypothetical protein